MFNKKNSRLLGVVMFLLAALMIAGILTNNLQIAALLEILTILYIGGGIISIIAYWPTIKDLINKKPSANITTYAEWTVGSAVSLLYGMFVSPDMLYRIMSVLYFVLSALVLLLAVNLKNKGQIEKIKINSKLFSMAMLPLGALVMAIVDNLSSATSLNIITILYLGTPLINIKGYLPTIKDLINKKPSANITTYAEWTTGSGISSVYGLFMSPDKLFGTLSVLYFVLSALVLLLAVKLKYKRQIEEKIDKFLPEETFEKTKEPEKVLVFLFG